MEWIMVQTKIINIRTEYINALYRMEYGNHRTEQLFKQLKEKMKSKIYKHLYLHPAAIQNKTEAEKASGHK